MIGRKFIAAAAAAFSSAAFHAAPASAATADISLWRLDCGTIEVSDIDLFSDAFLYAGQQKTLTDSCYLIRHGDKYLLWDTGLGPEYVGKSVVSGAFKGIVKSRIVDQLARIGVRPEQVNFVGISHSHNDHLGQAADFSGATLLIGGEDFEAAKSGPTAARIEPWTKGGSKVETVARDKDIFGDGSVVMLGMPGHTPGHHSLLVRLPKTGAVLLTGDLYHFHANVRNRGVPSFNTNRADTLASMERFQAIANSLKARVVIQHEPDDIAKLPAFPQAAQ